MKTFEIITSSKTYICTEATPQQLVEMCEKIGKGKLSQKHRNKLRNNIEIYRNNPNNIGVKKKVLSVVLENITRKQLLKECNMLTHYTNDNCTIICNILETRSNSNGECYVSSMRSI